MSLHNLFSPRRWRRPSALALLALFSLTLLAGCGGAPESELWVIGLDGADWDALEPYMARGDMPNLTALRRDGAWGKLRSDEPMLSPILWTSLATGKTADLHGVTWFMSDAPDGTKIPVSSRNRWVRTFWNIASENDIEVGILGWWATWPAEPVKGFLVSDYVAFHSFGVTGRDLRVPGKTWPPEIMDDVERLFPQPYDIDDALLQRMVNVPADQLGFDASAGPFGSPIEHLRQSIATSRGYTDLSKELLQKRRPRLFSVYYEGTDATEHLFNEFAPPRLPWVSDEDFERYSPTVAAFWKWQDELLGELLEHRRENTTVMIISDHGFRTGDERLKEEAFSVDTADQSHMIDGVILLNGPGIQRGSRIRGSNLYDVAPTVLHILGLPAAQDMKGSVLESAFTEEYLTGHPVTTVDTYETGPWDRGDDIVVDEGAGERLEEMLKSLGYISGSDDGGETASTNRGGNVEQDVNMAVVLRKQRRYDEAATLLRDILARAPSHVEARFNLGNTYGEMGRLPEAELIFRGLVMDRPDDLRNYENLALTLARQEKPGEALKIYEQALEHHPDWAGGHAGKGFALHKTGDSEAGLRELDEALELDPRSAEALYYRGAVFYETERIDEARESLAQALRLAPGHGPASGLMAQILMAEGDDAAAQSLLQNAPLDGGGDPRRSAQLGTMALQAGRFGEAVRLLEEANRGIPEDSDLLGNLGLAHALNGNLPRSIELFERVLELNPELNDARAQLGNLYAQMGRMEEAERYSLEAVEADPNNGDLHMAYGYLLHTQGKLDVALQQYTEAIRLNPNAAPYHMQLGVLYQHRGEQELARRSFERARSIDPSLPMPPPVGGGSR